MGNRRCSHCGTEIHGPTDICRNCGSKQRHGAPTAAIVLIICVVGGVFIIPILLILSAIIIPNIISTKAKKNFATCQSNCREIGSALEAYAAGHNDRYPDRLNELVSGKYLISIPTCPSAGVGSYSSAYTSSGSRYTFYCNGKNHVPTTGANYPQYTSEVGLITRARPGSKPKPSRPLGAGGSEADSEKLATCKSNCKEIGEALEAYSTDHDGRYPKSLARLTPGYLKSIPTCPAAKEDTYSTSYKVCRDPDSYTFYCTGSNHLKAGMEADFPQYNSTDGLGEDETDSNDDDCSDGG